MAEAAFVVAGLRVVLALVPLRRVYPALERGARLDRKGPNPEADARLAHTVARMVEMASRHTWGQPTCLHRSLAVWWLLRRRGVDGHLRFGVRRRAGVFEAHAWVEHAGGVVNDEPMTADEYRRLEWIVERQDA